MLNSAILDLFINNISQFVFWKDRNSVYLGCNKNFASYAGYEHPNEIKGKTDYDLPWSKEEADFFIKIDTEVMNSGIPQLNFEEQQTLVNGSSRWLSTSKMPIFDAEKRVVGILGWYIDITPYKSMQLQINEQNNTLLEYSLQLEKSKTVLENVNHDLELFTYAVSHDLKSPIRNIINFADLILKSENDNLDKKILDMLNFILDSGKKMNNLVGDILTYAKTGSKDLSANKVKIKSLISNKLSDLDQIVLKSSNVILDFPDSLVNCYPELLGLVFYNLIGNGLKYNESEKPTVKCTMTELSSEIIFSISDNGIGIKPEFSEMIFQPFKRLHSSKFMGSGLGLSICKRIIELHNGRIWVDTELKTGSNIKFTISKHIN